MAAKFEAFTANLVLQSLQKRIETVDVWEDKVMVGLSDGTLMILEPDQAREDSPYQVMKALRSFGKKSLYQIQVQSLTITASHNVCQSLASKS